MVKTYSTIELGEALGLESYAAINRIMNRLDKEGILTPSIGQRNGSGSKAVYSHDDYLAAKILFKVFPTSLGSDHVTQQRRLVASGVKKFKNWPYLIVRENSVQAFSTAHQVMASIDTMGFGLVIPLADYLKDE